MTKSQRLRKAESLRNMAGRMFLMETDPEWSDYAGMAERAREALLAMVNAIESE